MRLERFRAKAILQVVDFRVVDLQIDRLKLFSHIN